MYFIYSFLHYNGHHKTLQTNRSMLDYDVLQQYNNCTSMASGLQILLLLTAICYSQKLKKFEMFFVAVFLAHENYMNEQRQNLTLFQLNFHITQCCSTITRVFHTDFRFLIQNSPRSQKRQSGRRNEGTTSHIYLHFLSKSIQILS